MSREKKKKSTSKYRKYKISPLIPIVAVIEVFVLVAISTYAWFIIVQEKTARTGLITVDADSGLNIDFKNANYDDEINLWDYVADDFKFSPVTSLDGRNVFVPTSGTFGNDTTNNIVYRDATINDINTRYIDVDFTLTNSNNQDVSVYLNNKSSFEVYRGGVRQDNSRALRLAFYTNDAKHGNVSSSILENTNDENVRLDRLSNSVTVYFNKPSHWNGCNAYVWKTISGTDYVATSWPGSAMTHVAGSIYSYTFSNTEEYDKVIFNNGNKESNPEKCHSNGDNYNSCTQTDNLTITNGDLYQAQGDHSHYDTKTVYFRKPSSWSTVKAHAFKQSGDYHSFTEWPGDLCTNCGADIYSYTFPVSYDDYNINGIQFNDGTNNNKSADLVATDGKLYYFNGSGNGACDSVDYGTSNIYLNNSLGWTKPYVKLTTDTGHVTRIAMTNLSAGVYYATVPSVYTHVSFEERAGLDNINTDQTTINKYTQQITYSDGHIYRPNTWTNTGYDLTDLSYTDTVGGSSSETYAVISPGVSAGFQRSYTPVVGVNNSTGSPIQVVPAFASSLDNYIKRSGKSMFTIPANGMLDLSMIIWLEGTDADCTNDNYASTDLNVKDIRLYLEFSTTLKEREGVDDADYYTYRFYDKTRECWTSDRLTNVAGVSVAPVMQLYDNTAKRGYLMHAISTTSVGGTRKIDVWECQAPAVLYTGDHDLYFRRVDPYNEDEVWNYWHPVNPQSCAGAAFQTYTSDGEEHISINFTAFADGAPANGAESGIAGNDAAIANNLTTPTRSCGGLWGIYETELLTVIDGTNGNWYKNNKAVMTLNYTYTYGTGVTQTIEYKASGPNFNQVYYLVVPRVIKDDSGKASGLSIKRYYNFNSEYAMNIKNRNSSMTFSSDDTFTFSGALTGYYAYFTKDGNTKDQWYGDGINYINICYQDNAGNNSNNKNMFGGARYKVEFHTGASKTVKLYTENGSFSLSGFNGYLTVPPKNATKLQLRHCSTDWNTTYDYSDDIDVSNHNILAYYWAGGQHNVGTTANNNQGNYGWPAIPAYSY